MINYNAQQFDLAQFNPLNVYYQNQIHQEHSDVSINDENINISLTEKDSWHLYQNLIKCTVKSLNINIYQPFIVRIKMNDEFINLQEIQDSLEVKLLANVKDKNFTSTQLESEFKKISTVYNSINNTLNIHIGENQNQKILNIKPFILRKDAIFGNTFEKALREIYIRFKNNNNEFIKTRAVVVISTSEFDSGSPWVNDPEKIKLFSSVLKTIKFNRATENFISLKTNFIPEETNELEPAVNLAPESLKPTRVQPKRNKSKLETNKSDTNKRPAKKAKVSNVSDQESTKLSPKNKTTNMIMEIDIPQSISADTEMEGSQHWIKKFVERLQPEEIDELISSNIWQSRDNLTSLHAEFSEYLYRLSDESPKNEGTPGWVTGWHQNNYYDDPIKRLFPGL